MDVSEETRREEMTRSDTIRLPAEAYLTYGLYHGREATEQRKSKRSSGLRIHVPVFHTLLSS